MSLAIDDSFAAFLDPSSMVDLLRSEGILFLVLSLVILYIARVTYSLLSPFNLDEQLTKHDNKAVALSFGGFMVGVGVILVGIMQSPATEDPRNLDPLVYDILSTVFWGLGGVVLLLVARFINDKLIFSRFNNAKELVTDRNVGTGAVEFGSFIGSAIIIYSAQQGESIGLVAGIVTTFMFFLMGQLAFWGYAGLYQMVARYDVHQQIEQDNIAAGVSFGLNLIAISLMIGGFIRYSDSVVGFVMWYAFASILLLSCRYLVDKLILTGDLLDEEVSRDQNWGAAIVEGGVAIVIGLIASATFFAS